MKYEIIIPGIIGLLTGLVGSLIAPWVHWGIEKKKIRLNKRIELIKKVREELEYYEYDWIVFREKSIYSQIRSHLNKQLVKDVENSDSIVIEMGGHRGNGVRNFKNNFLDNLTMLEKKWNII